MPTKAKQVELEGWHYPKHLAGRAYGVVVHGDVAGIEGVRRALCDWLDWMGLIDAGSKARLDRFIGYYEPYATSHDALDARPGGAGRGAQRGARGERSGDVVARRPAVEPGCRAAPAAHQVSGVRR